MLQPKPGWVEIDPDQLWSSVVSVLKEAIAGMELNDLLIFFEVAN